jgi:hypothetical protein
MEEITSNAVQFTRFHLPDGRREEVTIDLEAETSAKARQLKNGGFLFAIEVLRTGDVHGDVSDDEGQLSNFLCANGPGMKESVSEMIENAFKRWEEMGRPPARR